MERLRVAVLVFLVASVSATRTSIGGKMEIKDVKTNHEIQQLGRFCVHEYNKRGQLSTNNDDGGFIVFREVVEAKRQVVSGVKYYLTIKTTSAGNRVRVFDSIVVVKPWIHSKKLIHFGPTTSTTMSALDYVQSS